MKTFLQVLATVAVLGWGFDAIFGAGASGSILESVAIRLLLALP